MEHTISLISAKFTISSTDTHTHTPRNSNLVLKPWVMGPGLIAVVVRSRRSTDGGTQHMIEGFIPEIII